MTWTGAQMRSAPGNPIRSPREGGSVHLATDGRDILLNNPDGWEVDRPGLWWGGPAGSDGTGGPFGNPPPGADGSGVLTSLPAVTRCTSIICSTIAGLPWQVFRGKYEELEVPAWIADPQASRPDARIIDPSTLFDVRLSPVEFWTNWVLAALWFGDGYVYTPSRDSTTGAPKPPLWQLHPYDVSIRDGTYWVKDVPLPAGSIIHLRGEPPYWNGHGSGVLTRHSGDLMLGTTIRHYAAGIFNTGVPAGYLKSTQPNMSADQAQSLKAAWLAQHGGARRSIAVLNATTDFHAVALSPVDAQLDATRVAALREVALAFGVPAYMLGVPGDSSTYANIESRHMELRTFTLLPWMRRIESTLDAEFPRGTSVKINTDGLLRADIKTRTDAEKTAIDGGWMTTDEVRALEDLPPLQSEGVT